MPSRGRAVEQLEVIDCQLKVIGQRLETLLSRNEDRRTFLESHADELADLRLVRQAELGRVMRVRMEAVAQPDPTALDVLGPRPVDPAARQSWSNALERAAVHRERWGMTRAREKEVHGHGLEKLLGGPPVNPLAASSYEDVAHAIRSAVDPEPATAGLDVAG